MHSSYKLQADLGEQSAGNVEVLLNSSARCVALPNMFWCISRLILHGFGSNFDCQKALIEEIDLRSSSSSNSS